MTNGNDLAFPTEATLIGHKGLDKREYFAAKAIVTMDDLSLPIAKLIMGSEPPKEAMDNMMWWIDAEARYKVLKADSLIKALNE